MAVNLNCDMGEGIGNDEAIMPYIHAVNIACGYHAGDASTMWQSVEMAIHHKLAIGAHPSFPDKKNFGRKEMTMPLHDIYELMIKQLVILTDITDSFDIKLNHVKPHGALYNMSARDPLLAETIAQAVKDFNDGLVLFGLSNSHSILAAKAMGLKTAAEVFADRAYLDDGSLAPRSQPGALIEDPEKAVVQVSQMINEGRVTTITGNTIPVTAETICIHGDGAHAIEFAKAIQGVLGKEK